MKAFKIDVDAGEIIEIDYDGTLKTSQLAVEGLISVFHWHSIKSDVIINDEGNFCFPTGKGMWFCSDFLQPIIGNALIVGPPDENGNSTPSIANLNELKSKITILKTSEVTA